MKFRKGQYVVCKYQGKNNGDLIAGRIESVRMNGDVLLTNLLSGSRSVKKSSVLSRRNTLVSKRQVDPVVDHFKKTGDKSATRKLAVRVASISNVVPLPVRATPNTDMDLETALRAFFLLSTRDQAVFMHTIVREKWETQKGAVA